MATDLIHVEPGNVVAIVDNRLLVFVRTGPLTMSTLTSLEAQKDRILGARGAKGVLAVMPGTAGVSKNDIVERQRQFVRTIASEVPDISFSLCILGDSVHAMAMRTVARLFVLGKANMAAFRDVDEGAGWLAGRAGIAPSLLMASTQDLVRLAGGLKAA